MHEVPVTPSRLRAAIVARLLPLPLAGEGR